MNRIVIQWRHVTLLTLLDSYIESMTSIKHVELTHYYSTFWRFKLWRTPRFQFHQRFSRAFFVRMSFWQLFSIYVRTFVRKKCANNVDEIDNRISVNLTKLVFAHQCQVATSCFNSYILFCIHFFLLTFLYF